MQTLVRSMPDLHKTLILAHLRRRGNKNDGDDDDDDWTVDELAMATEHAPFRHKRQILGKTSVGSQRKPRPAAPAAPDATNTATTAAAAAEDAQPKEST
jgi:hypothetical protein